MTTGKRAEVRHCLKDQGDVKVKEFTPGPLVSESKWQDWEPKFANYLCTILGIERIPLSYIIRDNDNPDVSAIFANCNE